MKTTMDGISVVTPTIRPAGLQHVYDGIKDQEPLEWLVEINVTGKTDFNQAMNKMIARAKGDWIVSVQDYITIAPGALEYIANLEPAFYTFPVKHDDTWDWRKSRNGDIGWQEWEICFGAAPRQWLIDIGGFDEQLDQAWGFDNVNVGFRAHQAGYPMKCDNNIESYGLDHDALNLASFKDRRDPTLHNNRLNDFKRGEKVNDVEKYLV